MGESFKEILYVTKMLSPLARLSSLKCYPEAIGTALAVQWSYGMIENGGMNYWLSCDIGDLEDYEVTINAYRRMDLDAVGCAIRDVLKLFPGGWPPFGTEERIQCLGRFGTTEWETVSKIEGVIYSFRDDVTARLAAYVRENESQFLGFEKRFE